MKVLMLVSDGFEEIEALSVVDILRRAGVEITICSVTGSLTLTGSHHITIQADCVLYPDDREDPLSLLNLYDAVVLPGGMPNSRNLREDKRVLTLLRAFHGAGRVTAAICAAPSALEQAGLLQGRAATSYPNCLDTEQCTYREEAVVLSGSILTSRGAGTALAFSFALLDILGFAREAEEIRRGILYDQKDSFYREEE